MAVTEAPVITRVRNTGHGSIQLFWKAVTGAVTYQLFRGTVSGSTGATGVSEIVTAVVDATGGTFTLTFGAQTTATIPANSTAAVVQAALEALSTIGAGNIAVVRSGSANAYTYTLTFQGVLAYTDVGAITKDQTLLTGGASTVTITVTTAGVSALATGLIDTTATGDNVYEDESGATATDYFYALRAKNASGFSPISNEVHVLRTDTSARKGGQVNVVKSVPVPVS